MGGPGGNAGNARKFPGETMSGDTFVLVELLDPTDSQYFKTAMKNKGLKDLTPKFAGTTFRSKCPTEDWMKKVANLDPEWWYISGHFARSHQLEAEQANEPKDKPVPLFANLIERWRVEIVSNNTFHIGGLRPPDRTQRFVERLKKGDRRWKDESRSGPRSLEWTFGFLVESKREIDITFENGNPTAQGKTEIVTVGSYSNPSDRFVYVPVSLEMRGTGLENYGTEAVTRGTELIEEKVQRSWIARKTPFPFPAKYSLEVNPTSKGRYELVFRVPKDPQISRDGCIGYVVSGRWEPGETLIKEEEDATKLSWANDQRRKGQPETDRDLLKHRLENVQMIKPQIARFVFSPMEIELKDDTPPEYCVTDLDEKYDVDKPETKPKWEIGDGFKRCPCEWLGATKGNKDVVSVKLVERLYDRSTDASFFNESYFKNEFQLKPGSPESWRIRMEYMDSRSKLIPDNFLEVHGSGRYSKAKVVLLESCNTLVLASVRKYLAELFPDAVILGHIHKDPDNSTPIIKNFISKYFSDIAKARAYDWEHIVSSWLSYERDRPWKDPIIPRSYGLAALYKEKVYGINIDNTFTPLSVLATRDETVLRLRLYSKKPLPPQCKPGCLVDVLLRWDAKGKLVFHKGIYEGDGGNVTDFTVHCGGDPFKDTGSFPKLTPENLLKNRGY
jgi:hypothetical protein